MVRTQFTSQDVRDARDRAYLCHGAIGIMNRSTSQIDVRALYLLPNTGANPVGTGNFSVRRITAVSGGAAMTPVKHDTGSANLPSQVMIREHPDSVTLSDQFRAIGDLPGYSMQGGGVSAFPQVSHHRRLGVAELFEAGVDTAVQRLTLPEGQGIAIVQDVGSVPHVQMGRLTLRAVSTGAVYEVFSKELGARREGHVPLLTVFNGIGSGVILEIVAMHFVDCGTNEFSSGTLYNLLPGLRLILADVIDNGVALTPISLDTANAALPASIEIFRNPRVDVHRGLPGIAKAFADFEIPSGATFELTDYQRMGNVRGSLIEPFWIGAPLKSWGQWRRLCSAFRDGSGITLRQGEGLALVHMWHPRFLLQLGRDEFGMRTYENFDVAMEFTHTPAPSGGGSGGARNYAYI